MAPCHFGMEAVLKKEIFDLGYDVTKVTDGRVYFEGDAEAICYANVFLRTAERILINVGEFKAETFEELFQGTKAIEWENYLPEDAKFNVVKAASVKSKLFSPTDIQKIMKKAKTSAECTHNHPEGIKGAQATALCIYLARKGEPVKDIRNRISKEFGYELSLSVEEIRPRYSWQGLDGKGNGGICQDSVPQAIICALEARDFEDAIRNAVSIGGDSDTIGCITGGIAEGLFGIPEAIREEGMTYLPKELRLIVEEFETKYGCR